MQAYFRAVETLLNIAFTLEPSVTTVAAMTMETPDAINAYSIAVAPLSSRTKRPSDAATAFPEDLNMAFCLLCSHHNNVVRCGMSGSSAGGIG